jgi:hypothetical protein
VINPKYAPMIALAEQLNQDDIERVTGYMLGLASASLLQTTRVRTVTPIKKAMPSYIKVIK